MKKISNLCCTNKFIEKQTLIRKNGLANVHLVSHTELLHYIQWVDLACVKLWCVICPSTLSDMVYSGTFTFVSIFANFMWSLRLTTQLHCLADDLYVTRNVIIVLREVSLIIKTHVVKCARVVIAASFRTLSPSPLKISHAPSISTSHNLLWNYNWHEATYDNK